MYPHVQPNTISSVSIYTIIPDSAQPRRAIPRRIYANWDGSPYTLADQVIHPWIQLVERETGRPVSVAGLFGGTQTERTDEKAEPIPMTPLEAALMKIIDLAASIRCEGLTNPITIAPVDAPPVTLDQDPETFFAYNYAPDPVVDVVPVGIPGSPYASAAEDDPIWKNYLPPADSQPKFIIETGERRWLAHHMLHTFTAYPHWSIIRAQLVARSSPWRQSVENNVRDDLNDIGRARQFALLLMDLLKLEGMEFQPFSNFTNERDFYAQVADGETYRIPRYGAEKLINAMGIKHVDRLRKYRRLLRLPYHLWVEGDEKNLTEKELSRLYNPDTVFQNTVSRLENPGNYLTDRNNKAAFTKVWRHMVNRQPVSRYYINHLRDWLDNVDLEFGTDDVPLETL